MCFLGANHRFQLLTRGPFEIDGLHGTFGSTDAATSAGQVGKKWDVIPDVGYGTVGAYPVTGQAPSATGHVFPDPARRRRMAIFPKEVEHFEGYRLGFLFALCR
jgi:hypothetical protein